jgi:CRISPR-associated protein Cas2
VSGRRRYLVCYDIRDPTRLRKVHKTVKRYGWSMQYSVFVCDLSTMELYALRADVGALLNHDQDSVALIDCGDPKDRGRQCFAFLGPVPDLPTAGPVIL